MEWNNYNSWFMMIIIQGLYLINVSVQVMDTSLGVIGQGVPQKPQNNMGYSTYLHDKTPLLKMS